MHPSGVRVVTREHSFPLQGDPVTHLLWKRPGGWFLLCLQAGLDVTCKPLSPRAEAGRTRCCRSPCVWREAARSDQELPAILFHWQRFSQNWATSKKSVSGNSREAKPSGRVLSFPQNKKCRRKTVLSIQAGGQGTQPSFNVTPCSQLELRSRLELRPQEVAPARGRGARQPETRLVPTRQHPTDCLPRVPGPRGHGGQWSFAPCFQRSGL